LWTFGQDSLKLSAAAVRRFSGSPRWQRLRDLQVMFDEAEAIPDVPAHDGAGAQVREVLQRRCAQALEDFSSMT
jgi:hypothetical protein